MPKKITIGIVGEISSGKTTVANYIVKKYKGSSHRFSTMLRDVADRMQIEKNRENLQKISTIFRQGFQEDILSKVIFHDVKVDKNKIIVIDGVRRLQDIKYLKKIKGFKLIYTEADMEKRYKRLTSRRENSDDFKKSFKEFKKDHENECESEIKELRKVSTIINNDNTLKNLYSQIDNIIKESL